MDRVEAVVFDWYGTLAAPNPDDWWPRLLQLVTETGGSLDQDGLIRWEADHPIEHLSHSISEDQYRRWQRDRLDLLLQTAGVSEPDRRDFLDRIEHDRYRREFSIYPDVRDALEDLCTRGLRVGLCSNWDWDLDRHLEANGIQQLFTVVLCSASFGFRKPHPAVFRHLCDRLELRPERIAFVGDSWTDDVIGSGSAGFQPIHLARGGCDRAAHDIAPCLTDLTGLSDLLGPPPSGKS